MVIFPLPSDRINTAAIAREIGRWTFFPLSPEDQCWVWFMGFGHLVPGRAVASWGCPQDPDNPTDIFELSESPSHLIRRNTGHSSDGWGHSLNPSTPGSCTTLHNHHLQRSDFARCSQLKSNPCIPEGRALASGTRSVTLWRAFKEDSNITFLLHKIKVTLGI